MAYHPDPNHPFHEFDDDYWAEVRSEVRIEIHDSNLPVCRVLQPYVATPAVEASWMDAGYELIDNGRVALVGSDNDYRPASKEEFVRRLLDSCGYLRT